VASARSVERLSETHRDAAAAVARGRALLEHLNALAAGEAKHLPAPGAVLESSGEKVWRELGLLSWCPVLTQSPHPALPWPSEGRVALPPLAPPRATRPPADAWLASSCMRVLDVSHTVPATPSSSATSLPSDAVLPAAAALEDVHVVVSEEEGDVAYEAATTAGGGEGGRSESEAGAVVDGNGDDVNDGNNNGNSDGNSDGGGREPGAVTEPAVVAKASRPPPQPTPAPTPAPAPPPPPPPPPPPRELKLEPALIHRLVRLYKLTPVEP
jgi:hypothetical protein